MNTSLRNITLRALLFAAIASLTACGGGAGTTDNLVEQTPPPTGTVGVFITDSPSDRFDKILVQVTQVDLLGRGPAVTTRQSMRASRSCSRAREVRTRTATS